MDAVERACSRPSWRAGAFSAFYMVSSKQQRMCCWLYTVLICGGCCGCTAAQVLDPGVTKHIEENKCSINRSTERALLTGADKCGLYILTIQSEFVKMPVSAHVTRFFFLRILMH
jgi:hypothetical protein